MSSVESEYREREEYDEGVDDTSDCESEDEWETVYAVGPAKDLCHPLYMGTYYQTCGGGPEGGYIVLPDTTVFKIERNWHQPWRTEELEGKALMFEAEDAKAGKVARCRLVEKTKLEEKLTEEDYAEMRDKNFIARIQRLVTTNRPPQNIRQSLDLLMREWASYSE